jgi:hypothetical protein
MGKNNQGELTVLEREELRTLVREAEEVMLTNLAKAQDRFDRLVALALGLCFQALDLGLEQCRLFPIGAGGVELEAREREAGQWDKALLCVPGNTGFVGRMVGGEYVAPSARRWGVTWRRR